MASLISHPSVARRAFRVTTSTATRPRVLCATNLSLSGRVPFSTTSTPDRGRSVADNGTVADGTKFQTLNQETPFQLCFVRHGQSTWNRDNIFIGWTDTPLTDDGVLEARVAGQMLERSGILFDEVHTSLLRRCVRTVNLILMEMGQEYIPVFKHWRLNERNYGNLVGRNKKQAVAEHGQDQVKAWRRSYDEPPPPMCPDHAFHPAKDRRYRHVSLSWLLLLLLILMLLWGSTVRIIRMEDGFYGVAHTKILFVTSRAQMIDQIPKSESLKDTRARSSVYWDEVLAPALRAGKTVLVTGHENNLRSLIMRLEGISEKDIINLNLPRAVPLAYRLDANLKPLDRADGKLDEATGFLRGEWLGGDKAVQQILERDHKQVYDTSVKENLEIMGKDEKINKLVDFLTNGKGANDCIRVTDCSGEKFEGGTPVPGVERDAYADAKHDGKMSNFNRAA